MFRKSKLYTRVKWATQSSVGHTSLYWFCLDQLYHRKWYRKTVYGQDWQSLMSRYLQDMIICFTHVKDFFSFKMAEWQQNCFFVWCWFFKGLRNRRLNFLILRCKTKSWFGPKNEAKTSESSLVLAWGQFGPTEMGLFLTPNFWG